MHTNTFCKYRKNYSHRLACILLNVYLPYQCEDNFDEFMEYMGKSSDIIEETPCTHVCILGDFNAGVLHII